jgi:hypothetical protein
MNAADMAHVSTLLQSALDSVGILVERADVVQGNIKAWETVPAPAILGRWLQNGWRVRDVGAGAADVTAAVEPERKLRLVK